MNSMAPASPAAAGVDRIGNVEWVPEDSEDLLPSETFRLDSEHVGDSLEITVALPRAAEAAEPFSTVYVFDPIFNLRPAAAVAHMLKTFAALTGSSFPSLAMVGIGYPARDPLSVMGLRARDLTPTDDGFPSEIGAPPVPFGFGGAQHLLTSIVNEVIPEVEERFPVGPGDRTLLGHSFGGLFGLYTLFHRPEAFERYLIVSPSIWWNNRIVMRYEELWAKEHSDLPAAVFLAVGENEVVGETWRNESFSTEALALLRQVDNARELTERLRGRDYPSLSFESVVLQGEYHLTMMPAAVTRGLLVLFDKTDS